MLSAFANVELFALCFPGHLFPELGEDNDDVFDHDDAKWIEAERILLAREWASPTLRTVFMAYAFDESLEVYGLSENIGLNRLPGRFSCWKCYGDWIHCEDDDGGRDFSFGGDPFQFDCRHAYPCTESDVRSIEEDIGSL